MGRIRASIWKGRSSVTSEGAKTDAPRFLGKRNQQKGQSSEGLQSSCWRSGYDFMNAIACWGSPNERKCIGCLCFIQCYADQAKKWQRGKEGNPRTLWHLLVSLLFDYCTVMEFWGNKWISNIFFPTIYFWKKLSNILGKNFMIYKKVYFLLADNILLGTFWLFLLFIHMYG